MFSLVKDSFLLLVCFGGLHKWQLLDTAVNTLAILCRNTLRGTFSDSPPPLEVQTDVRLLVIGYWTTGLLVNVICL